MKRLIKKSEFVDAIIENEQYIEFYKNPSEKEIKQCKNVSDFDSIRGVILNDGTEYCWRGDIVHDQLKGSSLSFIDVNQFRFAFESGFWIFDCHKKFKALEMCKMIIKYENKLSKYGSLDDEINLFFALDEYENDDDIFDNINELKTFVNNNSEVKSNEEIN